MIQKLKRLPKEPGTSNTVIYGTPVMQMSEKRPRWRKNQTEKRKRLILERPAPDYPNRINTRDYYDEIIIRRHSPQGVKETIITLFMCPTKIDSLFA